MIRGHAWVRGGARASFGVMLGVTVAVACSARDGAPPVDEASYPSVFAEAFCDAAGGCCTQAGFAYDRAACTDRYANAAREAIDMAHRTSPWGRFDPQAAGRCVAAYRKLAGRCVRSDDADEEDVNVVCSATFAGTRKVGDVCVGFADCEASPHGRVFCNPSGSDGASRCVLLRDPRPGDRCPDSGPSRGDVETSVYGACTSKRSALYCDRDTGTCRGRIAIGGACEPSFEDPCVRDAACVGGTCREAPKLGERCEFACAGGLYCDAARGACAAVKGGGAPCSYAAECATESCVRGRCAASAYVSPSFCDDAASAPD